MIEKHFDLKPPLIAKRFKFHKRDQLPGESLADYIAELYHLMTHCAFGEYLEDALQNRLFCGLRSEGAQRRLLVTKNLTLPEAMETALTMEAARTQKPCREKKVPSTKYQTQITPLPRSKSTSTRTHYVETEQVSDASDELDLFTIGTSSKPKPLTCEVIIEGCPLVMEVDTGAEVSVISEDTCQAIFPALKPVKSSLLLKMYANKVISIFGELQVKDQYGKQTEVLKLIVVSGSGPSLLGRDWLQKLSLDWQNMYHHISSPLTELSPCIQNILS